VQGDVSESLLQLEHPQGAPSADRESPGPTEIGIPKTTAAATFLLALPAILPKVALDTPMAEAACSKYRPSRSASLRASTSSGVRTCASAAGPFRCAGCPVPTQWDILHLHLGLGMPYYEHILNLM